MKPPGFAERTKWKGIITYDGTRYAGFQTQPDAPTIQGTLEAVLERMHQHPAKVVGAGRTDAGVHARGQVIHFESELNLSGQIWQKALNAQLPPDIRVTFVEKVPPHFHARYDAKGKEYRYFIFQGHVHNPFFRYYSVHVPFPLDVGKMRQAARLLVGTHDFTSFSSARTSVVDRVRTIETLNVEARKSIIMIRCRGDGFLYNMVRIVVGTLIEVGKGKKDVEDVARALEKKDRTLAGPTAPPHGLFLWKVYY